MCVCNDCMSVCLRCNLCADAVMLPPLLLLQVETTMHASHRETLQLASSWEALVGWLRG